MPEPGNGNRYAEAFAGNDESLAEFLAAVREFDEEFCRRMCRGDQGVLRLEVSIANHKLRHVKVVLDNTRQPRGRDRR